MNRLVLRLVGVVQQRPAAHVTAAACSTRVTATERQQS
jgi:hypothetical protein